jgi:quercetin dioxygenase-like cupin family protein
MEKIDIKVSFEDMRGQIVDLIQNEDINAVTLITFIKGAVRGNHYHKATIQWNYLITGKIQIISRIPNKKTIELTLLPGDLVRIDADERHALKALEESLLLVMTKGPRGGKEYEVDTFRLEKPLI